MLSPTEQYAMATTLRALRREKERDRYSGNSDAMLTAIRAGDALDAVQQYVITAKVYPQDPTAMAVWEMDIGSPVADEPALIPAAD